MALPTDILMPSPSKCPTPKSKDGVMPLKAIVTLLVHTLLASEYLKTLLYSLPRNHAMPMYAGIPKNAALVQRRLLLPIPC